ncbi:bifunctional glutamate N-acetyltransferase/amino-acid acetyltransferase ArgJ [Oceanicella sp. SM1341]|uniref:bifunctional glutamate N-acetyltransferase/amino-acid acetyltransferase ArgJ n=1 Tax=Oceanicella sp. SM1341 TaxID=1548889 RepID=UPI000E4AEC0A|nr:bifunctional glutamate N-acetyltransferase/amino-acid acetyltransferase ArgJ [Oceanicella sp. SM1341]
MAKDKKAKKAKADKKKDKVKKAGAAPVKAAPAVSPLAPEGGFPALPAIAGVRLSAVEAGVRYKGRLDVMLAEIDAGASVAGVFTRSLTRSAPVHWCEEIIAREADGSAPKGKYGILVNSGNSNAFTGSNGRIGVETTAASAAAALGTKPGKVFVASTGVIGEPLPAERITAKMDELAAGLAPEKMEFAARAIMTTDTFPKGCTRTLEIDGTPVTISGFAKGSGMIAPDMATMLVFIFTDAAIEQPVLQKILSARNAATFNCITVDGDTSTSDSLVLAATNKAKMAPITSATSAAGKAFSEALGEVMLDLAQQVVRDGEGATKFVSVSVTGAKSTAAARTIGLAIANSPLVKTALAGEDPNWGRIVMAVGKSGQAADRDKLTIRFGDTVVAENGWVSPAYREEDGAAYMKRAEIDIHVDVGVGSGAATVWTCDLTHRYIEINADYRS